MKFKLYQHVYEEEVADDVKVVDGSSLVDQALMIHLIMACLERMVSCVLLLD